METYENIKALRIKCGMSQEELAKKAGYTDRSSIAKIEAGKVDLSESKIALLAKALNVSPAFLMGMDDGTDIFSVVDFDTATELLSKYSEAKEAVLKQPPFGLTAEDVQVAYDYHDLGQDAKRIVKSIIEAEKKAFEDHVAQIEK